MESENIAASQKQVSARLVVNLPPIQESPEVDDSYDQEAPYAQHLEHDEEIATNPEHEITVEDNYNIDVSMERYTSLYKKWKTPIFMPINKSE